MSLLLRYKLFRVEFSTDQVKKPLYLDALSSWFGRIPLDVEIDMPILAPMLSVLGYDPFDREPKYGEPDEFVFRKVWLEQVVIGHPKMRR